MRFMADQFVAKGEALGFYEFWINRYQQLIAAAIALAAAAITVFEMRRQFEQARRDNAERALTRYSMAIMAVMENWGEVFNVGDDEEKRACLQKLREVSDDVNLRSAMADSLFGKDQGTVAFF
jgi:hypothetical protein